MGVHIIVFMGIHGYKHGHSSYSIDIYKARKQSLTKIKILLSFQYQIYPSQNKESPELWL